MFNLVVAALKLLAIACLYLFLAYVLITLSKDVIRAGRRVGAPVMAARLEVVAGPGAAPGTAFPLTESATIGRADSNEVHLDDRFASEQHSRVTRTARGFVLEDLGSTNGTLYGERRLSEAIVLSDGDEFTVGQTTLRYEEKA